MTAQVAAPPITSTSAEVQAVLGVKPGTLRQWAFRGQVKKVGRDRYDAESVIA